MTEPRERREPCGPCASKRKKKKMTDIWIDVIPELGEWVITKELNADLYDHGTVTHQKIAGYKWRYQAVLVATFLAHYELSKLPKGSSVELIVRNRKGQIADKNTYGYDPEKSRG